MLDKFMPIGGSFKLDVPTGSLIEPLTIITPPSQPTHTVQQSSQSFLPPNSNSIPTSVTSEQSLLHFPPHSISSSVYSDSIVSNQNTRQSDTDSFALHVDTTSDEGSVKVSSIPDISKSASDLHKNETIQVLIASPKTPRKSLSLKSRRKTPQKTPKKRSESVSKFVLAIGSDTCNESDVNSQTPKINIPQLESSNSLDLPFSVPFPQNAPSDTPMNTDTVTTPGNTSGCLFSSFKVAATSWPVSRQLSGSNVSVESVSNNPSQHNSQSQEEEVQFVRPRKQRNSPRILFNSEEVHLTDKSGITSTKQSSEASSSSSPLSSVFQDSALTNNSVISLSESNISTAASSQTLPIQSVPSELSTAHINVSRNQELVTSTSSETMAPPTTILPPTITTCSSFQSPLPSTPLQFTSPSTLMSPSGLEELKNQVGQEGVTRYELRHIRTIRTVTEHRIVSSEIIENNRVLHGSTRVWPVSFMQCVLKVELV